MSTHFHPRPQPPPTPSSPVRPSTAHSTIRAVSPSPPSSAAMPGKLKVRPKSEQIVGSRGTATYARYVLQDEPSSFDESLRASARLRKGRTKSAHSTPVKSRSRSSMKRAMSTPPELTSYSTSPVAAEQTHKSGLDDKSMPEEVDELDEMMLEGETDSYYERPDTPTPMTNAQKRQAYVPLGGPMRVGPTAAERAQIRHHKVPVSVQAKLSLSPSTPAQATGTHQHPHLLLRRSIPNSPPTNRVSVSGASKVTGFSTASKNSVFSTPGRDELERKKPLVEADEGPFAKVQSMTDLDQARRRVSTGKADEKGSERAGRKKIKGKFGCGLECVVM